MEFIFETPTGEVKTVHLHPQANGQWLAQVGDQHYTLSWRNTPQGALILQINGQSQTLYAAQEGSRHFVGARGQVIALNKTTLAKARQRPVGDDLTAPLHGQVTQILVQVGDVVEKGQTLVVLEAMKMEMRVKATHAGVVKALFCQAGAAVERGQTLIEVGDSA